ncbi:serine hydrolase [Patescibacteria group bacterium]|nr:serine hydrolase [Patescibacteria group bacterium]
MTTKKTLYAKNIRQKLPLASLTKIMTAIIALENPKKDDRYIVKKEYLVGEDSMGLDAGEILNLKELLYGLILHSGNDAAETIAGNYPGGRYAFIKAMNDKAKSLGLKDTNFSNPSGLPWDGDQFTTAYDLLIITNYALSNFSEFRSVSETFNYVIPKTNTHKEFILENETNLLSSYPGVKGVKTGYTGDAGYCLITYLDYDGHKIIGILLNSENRRDEMKELLDFGLKQVGVNPPPHD